MDFEERKRVAKGLVFSFLDGLSPPRGMDEAGQERVIVRISDAFARRMPVSDKQRYEQAIIAVFEKIMDAHISYSWPPQGLFVDAMPKSEIREKGAAPESYRADVDDITAKAMNSRQGVPERYVWGHGASRLINNGLVDRETIDEYRAASVRGFIEAYRHVGAEVAERRLGPIVRPYFGVEQ